MKVILQKPVDKLGVPGDMVDVADGYARNYLMPRGLAVQASEQEPPTRWRVGTGQLCQLAVEALKAEREAQRGRVLLEQRPDFADVFE